MAYALCPAEWGARNLKVVMDEDSFIIAGELDRFHFSGEAVTRQPCATASRRRLVSALEPAELIDFFMDRCDEKNCSRRGLAGLIPISVSSPPSPTM